MIPTAADVRLIKVMEFDIGVCGVKKPRFEMRPQMTLCIKRYQPSQRR
jgi:hypothetical protein